MVEKMYSEAIAKAIYRYFKDDDWKFNFDVSLGIFRTAIRLRGKISITQVIIKVRNDDFVVFALSPVNADSSNEKMMANMAEFVCRVNYGLPIGNFDLDLNDGEIRYKSYVECAGLKEPTLDMIKSSLFCVGAMLNRFSEGLLGIIFENMSAEEAIAAVYEEEDEDNTSDSEDDTKGGDD